MSDALTNQIKELILSEQIAPGERVTEAGLAERLGVSRTPVRNVLPRLAAEGLLQPVGRRGFAVARFGEKETLDAIELRSLLEGWAAKHLATEGVSDAVLSDLDDCLAQGDEIFQKRHLDLVDERRYGDMNERFHRIIIQACSSPLLQSFVDRLNTVPFVAPSVIVFDQIGLRRAFDLLFVAHGCHHSIVDAIRGADGNRAEALFREHAHQQRYSLFARREAKGVATGEERPSRRRRSRVSNR